jgi:hypothetical protein
MKEIVLAFVLTASSAQEVPDFVQRPPAEYLDGPSVGMGLIVVPANQIDPACRSIGGQAPGLIVGCYREGVVVLPDPCVFPDEIFAQIACHEVAHRRGWEHPVQPPNPPSPPAKPR